MTPPPGSTMDAPDQQPAGSEARPDLIAVGTGTPVEPEKKAIPIQPAAPPLIRLLLVDDHEDTNRSLMLLLGRRGYKVRTATTLHDAVTLAEIETFDVLVCDMSLPDGNGLELLPLLRNHPPIHGGIMVSGYNDEEDLERSRVAGYKAHLSKPVDVRQLDETIRRLIDRTAEPR